MRNEEHPANPGGAPISENRVGANRRTVSRRLFSVLLILNLYVLSFLILANPCKKINRAPYDPWFPKYPGPEKTDWPPAPGGTVLCVSENPKLNKIAYWFYLPLVKFLEWQAAADFAYDPTKEMYNQPRGG